MAEKEVQSEPACSVPRTIRDIGDAISNLQTDESELFNVDPLFQIACENIQEFQRTRDDTRCSFYRTSPHTEDILDGIQIREQKPDMDKMQDKLTATEVGEQPSLVSGLLESACLCHDDHTCPSKNNLESGNLSSRDEPVKQETETSPDKTSSTESEVFSEHFYKNSLPGGSLYKTSESVTEVITSIKNDGTHRASMISPKMAPMFYFDEEGSRAEPVDLQAAFKEYRKKRMKNLKSVSTRRNVADEARLRAEADAEAMWRLRMKFVEQAKKYFGIPYHRKYWTAEDHEYHSPLFLDCCGLVRRCLRDLRKHFGFRIGPWNQAYMFDTLPIDLKEEEMKPGDLVFISATYNNKRMKVPKHKMTHVEIWLGEGPKTIGARWQKGKVQIFDNYRFEAKSYHSETYHFKSIDTWLMGICRSFCPEHDWRTRDEKWTPDKKSVFALTGVSSFDPKLKEVNDEDATDDEDDETATPSSSDVSLAPEEETKPRGRNKYEVINGEVKLIFEPQILPASANEKRRRQKCFNKKNTPSATDMSNQKMAILDLKHANKSTNTEQPGDTSETKKASNKNNSALGDNAVLEDISAVQEPCDAVLEDISAVQGPCDAVLEGVGAVQGPCDADYQNLDNQTEKINQTHDWPMTEIICLSNISAEEVEITSTEQGEVALREEGDMPSSGEGKTSPQ